MFQRAQQVRGALHFVMQRLPHYGPPLHEDLRLFRDELVRATVAAGVAAVSGLFFACFVSIAVIVTAWDTHARLVAVWGVCIGWGVVAAIGLGFARKAVAGPPPFRLIRAALLRDYAQLESVLTPEPGK